MRKKQSYQFLKTYFVEILFITFSAIFSIWLMFGSFGYSHGQMLIASKAWSDFAQHIPLIRSFSFGSNFPPQDPLFPGYPIRYHFLFFLIVGFLEKIGMRIDISLNILSTIGFFLCLMVIYFFAKKLFNSKAVGILSVLFFLFNGTLSFIYFFSAHPLSLHTIQDIVTNNKFSSFGPYDSGIVAAFWNMNIYTNQRHLTAAFALSIGVIGIFLFHAFEKRKPHLWMSVLVGVILGLSFFFHLAVFLMTVIVIGCLFFFFSELRIASVMSLFVAAIFAVPQYLYMKSGGGSGNTLVFAPGYLIHDHLTVLNFINYWFYNLGLHLILIPMGFVMAPKNLKKIFLAFLSLFILGNLIQFGPEMAVNHKFFNYFMLVGVMFSAFALVKMWQDKPYSRIFIMVITFFLVLSGIIDFFPVYNDSKITLADYPLNQDATWILKNTQPSALFLNTNYLYDSASLAGRKIFLGWPYFAWSAGFDTTARSNAIKNFLTMTNSSAMCIFLQKNRLDYISLATPSTDFQFDKHFWEEHFTPVYKNNANGMEIYKTSSICKENL